MAVRVMVGGSWVTKTKMVDWEKMSRDILGNKNGPLEVGVMIVGAKEAKQLNWEYRRREYVPQVLTFPNNNSPDIDGVWRAGDVVICGPLLLKEGKGRVEKLARVWLEHGFKSLPSFGL